jgi:hypothetical protein
MSGKLICVRLPTIYLYKEVPDESQTQTEITASDSVDGAYVLRGRAHRFA